MVGTPSIKEILKELERQKWRIESTANGHWKAYPPGGQDMITLSNAKGDWRTMKNILSQLRRQGFVWPPVASSAAKEQKKPMEVSAPSVEATVPARPPPEPEQEDLDHFFEELKRERTAVRETYQSMQSAAAKLQEAQKVYDTAEQAFQAADKRMQEVRALFDAALEDN